MDENITPILVALIGSFQVILAIYFGRRNREALAEKEKSAATVNIGESYSTLVQRLETRLTTLEAKYDSLCKEYEEDKAAWKIERRTLTAEIIHLEMLIDK